MSTQLNRWNRPFVLATRLVLGLLALSILRAEPSAVRVGLVIDVHESGIVQTLVPRFEAATGLKVELRPGVGTNIMEMARSGNLDLVIIHYGYAENESFVLDGFGTWPQAIFANQSALLGPSLDPAHIRGLSDATEGFRQIAQTKSLYLVNNLPVLRYLEDVLWEGAGRPEKGAWYLDLDLRAAPAVQAASKMGAYVLWGLGPFLRLRAQTELDTEPLLTSDPLLQRIMVSMRVRPARVPNANAAGAATFETFLIAPETQALIRTFRNPGYDDPTWWPSGLHNNLK